MSSVRTFSRFGTGEETGGCECAGDFSREAAPSVAVLTVGRPLVLFVLTLTEAGRASSCRRGAVVSKLEVRRVLALEGRLGWVVGWVGVALGGGASGTKGFSLNSQDKCWFKLLLSVVLAVGAFTSIKNEHED